MALVIGKKASGELLDYNDGVTDYTDTIIGNAGADTIRAGGGADTLKGGGGADVLDGGSGHDMATYEDSNVGVSVNLLSGKGFGGTAEGDTLISIEDLYGSRNDDFLTGNSQDNTLIGAAGNDTLKGGGGADTLDGGDGNDVMQIDGVEDRALGGDGIDTVSLNTTVGMVANLGTGFVDVNPYASPETYEGGSGWGHGWGHGGGYYYGPFNPYGPYAQTPGAAPQLTGVENANGSAFNDKLIGSDGANVLSGMGGNDILLGRGGDDVIFGGDGKDYIFGGEGTDALTGGAGNDVFYWLYATESTFGGGKPMDVITDFQHGSDRIDLSSFHLALNDLLVTNNHVDGGVNYSYVGADANHNGTFDSGEFAIAVKMEPGTTLQANDFLF